MEFNRVRLIRLGKGQHAVWMHSALPRLGSIPLGCGTGGHDDCGTNSGEMDAYTGSKGLEGVDSGSNPIRIQESVWDVDPSLKGPPAAHGSI